MKKAWVLALVLLTAASAGAPAALGAATFVTTEPFEFVIGPLGCGDNPDEVIQVSGTRHTLGHVTENGQHSLDAFAFVTQGLTAVSLIDGTAYHGVERTSLHITQSLVDDQSEAGGTSRLTLVGPGQRRLSVWANFHLTFVNGTVKQHFEHFVPFCED